MRVDETILHRNRTLDSALDATSIKVLNWNIAKNNHDRGWAKDFLMILDQHQPDLIFLQEVRLCAATHYIAELAEISWSFAPNFRDDYSNTYFGVLTAAKSQHVTKKSVISKHYEPVTNTPKVSLFTEYPLLHQSETLLTINTHLINFVELNHFRAQLHDLEAVIALHKGPVIFAGDFNIWSRSRWLLLKETALRLGLSQASFTEIDTQKIKRFLLSPPLDYVFYRGLAENRVNASVLDSISSSDHNPMLVELFSLQARTPASADKTIK